MAAMVAILAKVAMMDKDMVAMMDKAMAAMVTVAMVTVAMVMVAMVTVEVTVVVMVVEATDDAERTYTITNQALAQWNVCNTSCNNSNNTIS